jgi:hypothetical protein
VANYPSDAGYAWWLMERFWALLAEAATERGGRAFVATPQIRSVSAILQQAPLSLVELRVPTGWRRPPLEVLRFLRENQVRTVYLTDRDYWSPMYFWFRACGVKSIVLHDHVPGERPDPGAWKLALKKARFLLPAGRADLYVGVSQFVRDRFIRVAGIPPNLCAYVRNGLSTQDPEK